MAGQDFNSKNVFQGITKLNHFPLPDQVAYFNMFVIGEKVKPSK